MSYSPKAIANEFLKLAAKSGGSICPMRMQKLVYFSHGWFLAFKSEPLIDEDVQAWTYGPVIESLYHEFKKYGSGQITEPVLDVAFDKTGIKVYKPEVDASDAYTNELLSKVWDVYKDYSAIQLSNITHHPDSPWYSAKASKKCLISNNDIKDYFNKQRGAN